MSGYTPHTVRTDTGLYALTAVWYGPGGNLPPARYTAWLFGIAVTMATVPLLMVVVPFEIIPRLILALGVGPVVGYGLTKTTFSHIDYYMPLRGMRQVLAAELDTPRPNNPKPTVTTHTPARIQRT